MSMRVVDINKAVNSYVSTALWSSLTSEGEPMDLTYGPEDVTMESRQQMADDVSAFITGCEEERPEIFDGMSPEQVGHDFWLTRNQHGAGFWDSGLGERGDWLTEMAHPYGESSLYVGDDGMVRVEPW